MLWIEAATDGERAGRICSGSANSTSSRSTDEMVAVVVVVV